MEDNTASFGGGIFAPAVSGLAGQHTLVIDSSTVSGNSASDAAGLAVQSDAISSVAPRVGVINSTFSGNIATNSAGAMLFNSSSTPQLQANVEHSTITLNNGGGTAGGIQLTDDVDFDISNSIIKGNIGGDDLVSDPAATLAANYNLAGTLDPDFAAEFASGTGNLAGVSRSSARSR